GPDQAAGPELDAAIPARHHHHYLVETLPVDRGQDRPPRGAGRLAVIAGTIGIAYAPGPAVVGGVRHAHRIQPRHGRVRVRHRRGAGKEAAVLDLDLVRGG